VNRAIPFSDPAGIELLVEQMHSDLNLKVSVTYQHHKYNLNTNLFGSYNIENIKAAIAAGLFFDVEINEVVDAVENYQPANNRSQIKITSGNTLICDSYNANPTSMKMALESFAGLRAGSKAVIIGDMLELGEKSEDEHIRLFNLIKSLDLEKVILVGQIFRQISEKCSCLSFLNVNELKDFLKNEPLKGKTILIKGSRGIGLERIYDLL
jgi:UDP-N-acetylmuramoyl-tripeptide--D-alanyl-D-alanine ligase